MSQIDSNAESRQSESTSEYQLQKSLKHHKILKPFLEKENQLDDEIYNYIH